MGDNHAEERKEAAMKTIIEEMEKINPRVRIIVGINGMFNYSEIEFSPSDIGMDEEEILKKLKGCIEQRTAELEESHKNFKPVLPKHRRSKAKAESVEA